MLGQLGFWGIVGAHPIVAAIDVLVLPVGAANSVSGRTLTALANLKKTCTERLVVGLDLRQRETGEV